MKQSKPGQDFYKDLDPNKVTRAVNVETQNKMGSIFMIYTWRRSKRTQMYTMTDTDTDTARQYAIYDLTAERGKGKYTTCKKKPYYCNKLDKSTIFSEPSRLDLREDHYDS